MNSGPVARTAALAGAKSSSRPSRQWPAWSGGCCQPLELEDVQRRIRRGEEVRHTCGRVLVKGRP
jgi:hypothetical protein